MEKNTRIVIERVANGFIVRSHEDRNQIITTDQPLVFNDMGYASGTGEHSNNPCLLTFIADHFTGGDHER
jgi:hypothetical protein